MTPSYAVEAFDAALPDIEKLIDQHWQEVGSYQADFDRIIDFPAYRRLDADGRLLAMTARDEGQMVGYAVIVVGDDLHRVIREPERRRLGAASALVNFMLPAYRGYARAFTLAAERAVANKTGKPTALSWRAKKANNAGRFFMLVGYQEMETTYTKVVSPCHTAPRLA